MIRPLLLAVCALLGSAGALHAADTRVVIDQMGRTVTLPAEVRRVVTLQHQSLDIIQELGAGDRLVGVLRSWRTNIPGIDRINPALAAMSTPGDLANVNIEELLSLHPDVVFVTNYAPAPMVAQIANAGLAVVIVSLSKGEGTDKAKLNPTFADDDAAYAEGLAEGVRLIGEVLGTQARAEKLIAAAFAGRHLVERRIAGIPEDQRVRLYMANPDLSTYGAGKYTGVIMARSGGRNVALGIRGASKVSMEDILRWDPQVIFVQDRFAPVADTIRKGAAWQPITAVRTGHVEITPEYVKPWGYPLPEAFALGELWMAKKLYPERFADIDMQTMADAFYREFYGIAYTGPN